MPQKLLADFLQLNSSGSTLAPTQQSVRIYTDNEALRAYWEISLGRKLSAKIVS